MFHAGENHIGTKVTSGKVLHARRSSIVVREQNDDEFLRQSFDISLNSGRLDYTISNSESNKVLQVDSSDGLNLGVLSSEPPSNIQRWELLPIGMEDNTEYYAIRSVGSGKCMELSVNDTVSCRYFSGNDGQQWKFIPLIIPGWDACDDDELDNEEDNSSENKETAELKARVKKLKEELRSKAAILSGKENNISDLKAEVNNLKVEVSSKDSLVSEAKTRISQQDSQLQEKDSRITQLTEDLANAQNQAAETAKQKEAQGFQPGTYFVRNYKSQNVVDLSGGPGDIPSILRCWSYHGCTNQQWRFERMDDQYFSIRDVQWGRYVSYGSIGDNTPLVLTTSPTRWRLYEIDAGRYTISLPDRDLVFDQVEFGKTNRINLHWLRWHGEPCQHWNLEPVE